MKSIKSCCLLAFLLSAVMLFTSCTAGSVTTDGVTDETTDLKVETVPETDAETVPESDIEDTVAPKDPVRISFVAMGDNLIHSPIFKQAALGGGKYDFLPKYAGVADMIGSADIAFINQETPMCGEEYGYSNYPQFNTPQQMGHDLVTLGFDVILGQHPHVVQPIEWIEGKEGNKTLCYYSLGNGISCQDYLMNMVGITASFDIVCEEGKRPYIENASCIPSSAIRRKAIKR